MRSSVKFLSQHGSAEVSRGQQRSAMVSCRSISSHHASVKRSFRLLADRGSEFRHLLYQVTTHAGLRHVDLTTQNLGMANPHATFQSRDVSNTVVQDRVLSIVKIS
eukprot:765006-Hanusia_phi.AAC.2